ncbi:NAD(P)/FAD-dependent oxidoreductase [Bacteriovorax sp. PP10]|uniref:NAD(P)/FAD-dependent oxidoreductase n=1 Tax=Bacteriovorax antarcticus TaxID=3088717 RepID=A0ABU5VTL6_9BACT|nr:NAD(P)/FAD-dependent oxidoreductase [Bacteriovorax sp. PP10]MEA9354990.1 NAD(P)/FAD-dependent oxidoreductase [Bacteriovorax sp. PP10]
MKKTVIIIGAGPAGLTSALLLAREGHLVTVYESDKEYVGGLSRTVLHNGFRFDIGGHRFYTKEKVVSDFWEDILKDDLLRRKRISRIFYKKKFLSYPLNPGELIFKLNPFETLSFMTSFFKTRLFPPKVKDNFENWVISNFGQKLYEAFFKSYTEKVWGIDCSEISSDWAVQRINNLNIYALIKRTIQQFFRLPSADVKSLIEEFDYPKLGPGMLWEKVRDEVVKLNGQIILGTKVISINQVEDNKWTVKLSDGQISEVADDIISTAPLREFIKGIVPEPPKAILDAVNDFTYRSFITVAIMFKGKNHFPDNWIYIHDQRVKVGRIQNYGNWSTYMTPGLDCVCYGLEYFCQRDDTFWKLSDDEMFTLAKKELQILGLEYSENELDFKVIRSPYAYPIYDLSYKERLDNVQKYLNQFENLHPIGRSGLHRYNNQDHSIKTAMLACENINLGQKKFNPWKVNQDAEYIEEIQL